MAQSALADFTESPIEHIFRYVCADEKRLAGCIFAIAFVVLVRGSGGTHRHSANPASCEYSPRAVLICGKVLARSSQHCSISPANFSGPPRRSSVSLFLVCM